MNHSHSQHSWLHGKKISPPCKLRAFCGKKINPLILNRFRSMSGISQREKNILPRYLPTPLQKKSQSLRTQPFPLHKRKKKGELPPTPGRRLHISLQKARKTPKSRETLQHLSHLFSQKQTNTHRRVTSPFPPLCCQHRPPVKTSFTHKTKKPAIPLPLSQALTAFARNTSPERHCIFSHIFLQKQTNTVTEALACFFSCSTTLPETRKRKKQAISLPSIDCPCKKHKSRETLHLFPHILAKTNQHRHRG